MLFVDECVWHLARAVNLNTSKTNSRLASDACGFSVTLRDRPSELVALKDKQGYNAKHVLLRTLFIPSSLPASWGKGIARSTGQLMATRFGWHGGGHQKALKLRRNADA